ncbi:hypothetical protein F7725_017869 [Dissostichus mawsoni]|uniref:Immunoglobulin V-set domain-containing protein n=1 Tax=Dissostichus mawsoni TaxID=36200 RepID=A0A7J5XQ06_DISMA|nr:hypothetical protein F7725_017869 [Dissostichus mawsoni]
MHRRQTHHHQSSIWKDYTTNRIQILNRGNDLFVTFTNLKKSDANIYYCGVRGLDLIYIKVNLKVTDAASYCPKKTPEQRTHLQLCHQQCQTSPLCLQTAQIISLMWSIPYLIIGVILIITILMVLLKFMSKKMMKQRKVVSTAVMPQEDAREEAEYDEIRHEEATDPDSLYANNSFLQDIGSAAAGCETNSRGACAESRDNVLYSVAQLPKDQIKPTGQSQRNQSESAENDSFYDLQKSTEPSHQRDALIRTAAGLCSGRKAK